MSALLVAAIVVVNLMLALTALGRSIVFHERAHFRNEVWRARDDLLDSVFSGVVPDIVPVRQYVDRLEGVARLTERWTPATAYRISRILRREGYQAKSHWLPEMDLAGEALDSVMANQRRYHHALARLMFFGSPSGWLTVLALPALIVVVRRKARTASVPEPVVEARRRRSAEAHGLERVAIDVQNADLLLPPGDIAEAADGEGLAYAC